MGVIDINGDGIIKDNERIVEDNQYYIGLNRGGILTNNEKVTK